MEEDDEEEEEEEEELYLQLDTEFPFIATAYEFR